MQWIVELAEGRANNAPQGRARIARRFIAGNKTPPSPSGTIGLRSSHANGIRLNSYRITKKSLSYNGNVSAILYTVRLDWSASMAEHKRMTGRWWFKLGVGALVVVLLGVGTILFMGWSADQRWQAYADMLRAAGEPLTLAEIEQRRPVVPDDRNGARILERIRDELAALKDEPIAYSVLVMGAVRDGGPPRATSADFFRGIWSHTIQPSRDYLEAHRAIIAELHRFDDYPSGRFEITPDTSAIDNILPNLGPVRAAVQLLALEAAVNAIDGDLESAIEDVARQLRLGGYLNTEPMLISRLVQMTTDALALDMLEGILRVGEVAEPELSRMQQTLNERLSSSSLRWALWGERAYQVELYEQFAGDRQSLNTMMMISDKTPPMTAWGWTPEFVLRKIQLSAIQLMSRLIEAADDPTALLEAGKILDRDVQSLSGVHVIVKVLMPSYARVAELHARSVAEIQCARVAMGAERFRLQVGRLPGSSGELVPDFIAQWPIDPLDGQPLRFKQTDHGILIYSVGIDQKDDGGSVTPADDEHRASDDGFRLLRMDQRRLVILEDNESPTTSNGAEEDG